MATQPRQKDGKFLPGHGSLNPGGRPKKDPELRAALQKKCPEAVKFLGEVVDGTFKKASLRDRIEAAKVIVAWSIPKPIDGEGLAGGLEELVAALTDDDKDDEPKG